MTTQTVRIGYIGAGKFSRSRLLPRFKSMPGVELVVVANSTPESSQAVAKEFGFARSANNWQEVVAAKDVDAIVVGTRTATHPEICIPVLESGRHLLCMNAIAPDLKGATAMLNASQARPKQVALVYPAQFYMREEIMMQWLLQQNYVGKVLHVFDYWYTRFFGLGSQFEVANRWFGEHTRVLGYRKGFEIAPRGQDHHARDVRPESNIVLAELASGATITYVHSTVAGESALSRFEVYGDLGTIVCYPKPNITSTDAQAKVGFYGAKSGDRELQPIAVPAEIKAAVEDPLGVPVEADFIAAVRGQKQASPAVSRFIDGVRLMQFANAWRKSSESGAWSPVP